VPLVLLCPWHDVLGLQLGACRPLIRARVLRWFHQSDQVSDIRTYLHWTFLQLHVVAAACCDVQ
jgi:hypothetical protein